MHFSFDMSLFLHTCLHSSPPECHTAYCRWWISYQTCLLKKWHTVVDAGSLCISVFNYKLFESSSVSKETSHGHETQDLNSQHWQKFVWTGSGYTQPGYCRGVGPFPELTSHFHLVPRCTTHAGLFPYCTGVAHCDECSWGRLSPHPMPGHLLVVCVWCVML
jgi:hypothetical protein